jgi:putative flippase GtrA
MISKYRVINKIYLSNLKQFFLYARNGLILNSICYLLYLFFTKIGCSPFLSITIIYPVGILLSYYFHSKYSFKTKLRSNELTYIFRYLIIYVLGYLLNIIILHVLHNIILLSHEVSQLIATIVAPFYFFASNKVWVFNVNNHKV